ncbi:MAG: hypothetical protein JSR72_14395 [Proteobacteria bacterium]|nr:hypothetical protein [Pseudomonadota bacterium]
MIIEKQVKQLAALEKAIARRAQRLTVLQADQQRELSISESAKERLALDLLRRRDAFSLPVQQLVAMLTHLDMTSVTDPQVMFTSVQPSETESNSGQPASAGSAGLDVTVRISRNASEKNREALSRAGMRWNGKVGRWVGTVDRSRLTELKSVFGDRVKTSQAVEEQQTSAAPASTEQFTVYPAKDSPLEPHQSVVDTGSSSFGGRLGKGGPEASVPISQQTAANTGLPVVPRLPMRPLPRIAGR